MPKRIWTPLAVLALAGAMASSGCAVSPRLDTDYEPAATTRGITLQVDNGNIADLRIYLLRSGVEIPVGSVGSMETRVFRLSRAQVGGNQTIRLLARVMGSRQEVRTIPIDVALGQRVEWTLTTNLRHWRVAVRY